MILREPGAVSGEGAAGAIPGGSSLWAPRTGTPSDPSYSRSGNRRSRIRAPIPLRLTQGVAPLGLHRKPIAVPQQCVPEIDPAALVRDLIPVVVIPGLEIRIVHRFAVLVRGEDGDAVELALGAVDRPAAAAPPRASRYGMYGITVKVTHRPSVPTAVQSCQAHHLCAFSSWSDTPHGVAITYCAL